MTAGQFRPVVAADRLRHSTLGHNPLQHPRHPPARKTGVHFQGQTLSCVRIHHAQHADRSPAFHGIVHEIQRPFLVRCCPNSQWLPHTHAVFAFLPPKAQPSLPVYAMHALVVHRFSRALQQHMQPSIAEARLLPRQLRQLCAQRFVRPPRLIAVTRYCHHHQAARPPLAEGISFPHLLDSCLQRYELHPFFRITDCNASLSRLRSATNFRSRVFSSLNCFASCAWLTSIPPYFAFQA